MQYICVFFCKTGCSVCVASPASWCRWGLTCPPPDNETSQSQTPYTLSYCSPRCSWQPGPGERSSFQPGTWNINMTYHFNMYVCVCVCVLSKGSYLGFGDDILPVCVTAWHDIVDKIRMGINVQGMTCALLQLDTRNKPPSMCRRVYACKHGHLWVWGQVCVWRKHEVWVGRTQQQTAPDISAGNLCVWVGGFKEKKSNFTQWWLTGLEKSLFIFMMKMDFWVWVCVCVCAHLIPDAMPLSIPTSWITGNCPSFCCKTTNRDRIMFFFCLIRLLHLCCLQNDQQVKETSLFVCWRKNQMSVFDSNRGWVFPLIAIVHLRFIWLKKCRQAWKSGET